MDDTSVIPQRHNFIGKIFTSKNVPPVPKVRQPNPVDKKPWLVFMWWYLNDSIKIGYNRIIQPNDLPRVAKGDASEPKFAKYKKYLSKKLELKDHAEFKAILYCNLRMILIFLGFSVIDQGCLIGLSLVSRNLIEEAEKLSSPLLGYTNHGRAVGLLIGYCLMDTCATILGLWTSFNINVMFALVRSQLAPAIHDKMLRLSPQQRHDYPAAKIITISNTDVARLSLSVGATLELLVMPINLGTSLGILIYMIGVSALPGIGLIVLGVIFTFVASFYAGKLRAKSMPFMDKRISLTRETLKNINIIKFYGWEESFVKLILRSRKAEVRYTRILEAIDALTQAVGATIPTLGGALSFAVKIIISSNLGPARAFPALSLFEMFISTMSSLSFGLSTIADAWVSLKRVNAFFRLPETPSYIDTLPANDDRDGVLFKIVDGSFAWIVAENKENEEEDKEDEERSVKVILHDINLSIRRGTMNLVLGNVGTGKTSLLSAFVNTIPKHSGIVAKADGVRVTGVLNNWSRSCSVKDNITFGFGFDKARYAETIRVCDLQSDLDSFPDGDRTEIGENGVTLSGGQKARLALARCIYCSGELIVLDDVLSAMDSKVSNFIFRELLKLTRSGKKTIVFSTNNLKLVSNADSVIILDGNGSARQTNDPTPDDLKALTSERTTTDKQSNTIDHVNNHEYHDSPALMGSIAELDNKALLVSELQIEEEAEEKTVLRSISNQSSDPEKGIQTEKLMENETRGMGAISPKVLVKYFELNKPKGMLIASAVALTVALYATSSSMVNVILNWWTGAIYKKSQGFFIGMYTMCIGLTGVFFLVYAIMISFMATSASTSLHSSAISGLYYTSLSYFHRNPLGRLMTRFTNDLNNLDTMLLHFLRQFLFDLFGLVASMIVIFVYIPWSILTMIPIFMFAMYILSVYQPSAREFQRINLLFTSKRTQMISENIEGQEVIQAYGQSAQCQHEIMKVTDDNTVSYLFNNGIHYWAAVRCGILNEFINVVTLFLAVFNVFSLSPSEVGLMISVLPSIREKLINILATYNVFYNTLNSVERLQEYAEELPKEGIENGVSKMKTSLNSWKPSKCDITFESASLRYRDNLPLALNNLSLKIEGGKKVGICGRTGAGKSTIISALFRFVELYDGKIEIDGQDISEIPLKALRDTFAIIPQAPILFQGTIRTNLDPFNELDDSVLSKALTDSGLTDSNGKFSLDANVESEGTNFSLGERQMIALARVLVRNSSVLILDEATAAVDTRTDERIQKAVKKTFKDRTVLCIAHRLETIIDYDEIIVMGTGGHLLEMGTPAELYNSHGVFTEMCKEAGVTV